VIGTVVKAIGDKALETLIDQGLPVPADTRVWVGKRYLDDVPNAPRIVFVPRRFEHGPAGAIAANPSSYPSTSPGTAGDAAYRAWLTQKPIYRRMTTFDVHVFGVAAAPDDATELDITETIADAVIWAARATCGDGSVMPDAGEWDPDLMSQTSPQTHHIVFGLVIATPVLDKPVKPTRAFVPPGTTFDQDVRYDGPTPEAP
jgi:hypothetical protein